MKNLLDNISTLFKAYGVKSVTMDDIAREFGISKKTLYKHFENKTDVVYKVAHYELDKESDELVKLCRKHKHVIDQLYAISKFIIEINFKLTPSLTYSADKYYHHIWKEMMNKRESHILSIIIENFYSGIKQGIYRKDVDINIIQYYYAFLLNIKSIEMYGDWIVEKFEDTFKTIFIYHIRGIANNVGLEYLEEQFLKKQKHE
jgi:AcrR family transcriptional regulator